MLLNDVLQSTQNRIRGIYVSMITNTFIVKEIEDASDFLVMEIHTDIMERMTVTIHTAKFDSYDTTHDSKAEDALEYALVICKTVLAHQPIFIL